MDQLEGRGSDDESSEDEEHSDASDEDDAEAAPQDVDADALPTSEEPPQLENLKISDEAEEKEGEDDEDDDGSDEDDLEEVVSHRRHRPSKRAPPPTASDVGSSASDLISCLKICLLSCNPVVTERLARQKRSTERQHHGKKPVSANVLGKSKGSKLKSDARRHIKDSAQF